MTPRVFPPLLLFVLFCRLGPESPTSLQSFSPPSRSFRFNYKFAVKDIPAGTKRIRGITKLAV
jgi:hypothetical protein